MKKTIHCINFYAQRPPGLTQRRPAWRCVRPRLRLDGTQRLPLSRPGALRAAVSRTHADPLSATRKTRTCCVRASGGLCGGGQRSAWARQPHLYPNDFQVRLKLPRPRGTCRVTGTSYGFWTGEKPRRHRQQEVQLFSEYTARIDYLQQVI